MFKTIAMSYRMGERTVSKIVSEVCNALWLRLKPKYLPEPTVDMWQNIASDYEKRWQFYNCLGAVDGKHVTIRKPLLSGSSFFNYKQHFSTVLIGLADANYRFTFIDVGSMGRFPDSSVFSDSSLGKQLLNGSLELPTPKPLPGQTCGTPYVFVADEAFPLMCNLMRPYPKAKVTNNFENKVFNYRLSRARQTIECAFGILSSRFRVYKRPFECKLETVDKVVMATCVLHNYLRTQKVMAIESTGEDDDDEIDLPSDNQLLPLSRSRVRCTKNAFLTRQKFTECFNSASGSVEWQRKAVSRGQY